MSSTTIAVIGSGIIGRTLATRSAQAGHAGTFGARIPGNADLTAPGILEALIPGRMQGRACTAEVPR
jgi:predicted dinucleotide-binding enzyme